MSGTSPQGPPIVDGQPVERRAYVRWSFRGTAFPVRLGKKEFEIRLKDLSRGGACGLMEEPLAIGDYVLIEFGERHVIEAQVRWVRRVIVG
ncbi:MAG TPA: PilZ domain-containing protein, partial [Sphingomonas sp.]|nr:PilZ domain-containing protein [Sphingomonas sp.]